MMKLKSMKQIQKIKQPNLRKHLENKVKMLSEEYKADYFKEIGYFVILDNEKEFPDKSELEFSEEITFEDEKYIHGVRIISDSCGEDIWLLR